MTQTTDAALVPEDVRALRVQNGALRSLNRCLEEEIKQHRAKAQEYHAATTTLDSEREANRILTDTIEAQARRIEALEVSLVAHNCGRPECVCVECCRKHPTPCDMHSDFSKWCGHCLEVNGFTSPDEAP